VLSAAFEEGVKGTGRAESKMTESEMESRKSSKKRASCENIDAVESEEYLQRLPVLIAQSGPFSTATCSSESNSRPRASANSSRS
jgi:hypothetical protein